MHPICFSMCFSRFWSCTMPVVIFFPGKYFSPVPSTFVLSKQNVNVNVNFLTHLPLLSLHFSITLSLSLSLSLALTTPLSVSPAFLVLLKGLAELMEGQE